MCACVDVFVWFLFCSRPNKIATIAQKSKNKKINKQINID